MMSFDFTVYPHLVIMRVDFLGHPELTTTALSTNALFFDVWEWNLGYSLEFLEVGKQFSYQYLVLIRS